MRRTFITKDDNPGLTGGMMGNLSIKKTILAYLKEHLWAAVCYGILILLFYLVAGLYGYKDSMRNMTYAAFLAAFSGLCAWLWGCARHVRHISELVYASSREEERKASLPESHTMAETCYQHMICDMEREKRRILSEYDEKKKDMADYYTMWTHQIKTPIAAMRLLLQEEGHVVSRQESEELFKIEQYAEMALHYARLDSLSSDLLLKTYDICSLTKQAVKQYSILFIGSGLSFSMEEFSCHAVTDEKWLVFVIGQLLSNALKYTPHGGIRVYGQTRDGRRTDGEASFLIIEDTGIGISESDLPRIFERGFTGYNGRLDKKSTGIGLYLCRQILDRLGHTIQVKSRMGEGTRATVGFVQDAAQ